jgi:hypothetical protein
VAPAAWAKTAGNGMENSHGNFLAMTFPQYLPVTAFSTLLSRHNQRQPTTQHPRIV